MQEITMFLFYEMKSHISFSGTLPHAMRAHSMVAAVVFVVVGAALREAGDFCFAAKKQIYCHNRVAPFVALTNRPIIVLNVM